ncbi:MAG: RNA 2',3'-cyclic phosphodiesterase [Paracoccaceae bacterium]
MRCFIAIELPEDLRDALEEVQADLPVGRTIDPETLHLTLAFLDDQPEEVVEAVHEALQSLRVPAFRLELRGLDLFGTARPRVVWARVRETAPLADLHDRVLARLRAAGLQLARRRFRPHVTLARFDRRLSPFELARLRDFLEGRGDLALPGFEVREIALLRSVLRPGGALHEVLATYPLESDEAG